MGLVALVTLFDTFKLNSANLFVEFLRDKKLKLVKMKIKLIFFALPGEGATIAILKKFTILVDQFWSY